MSWKLTLTKQTPTPCPPQKNGDVNRFRTYRIHSSFQEYSMICRGWFFLSDFLVILFQYLSIKHRYRIIC